MGRNQELGAAGEQVAAAWYERRGFTVIARNWRVAGGELDVICVKDGSVVVCEVKTRRTTRFGHPVEAITPTKLARLRRLTAAFVRGHASGAPSVRIDIAAVIAHRDGTFSVDVVEGVG